MQSNNTTPDNDEIMNDHSDGKFICNFEGCDRKYQNVNLFQKHLRRKHSDFLSLNDDPLNDDSFQNVATINGDTVFDTSVEYDEGNDFNEIRNTILLNGQRTGKFICTFEGCDRQYQNENVFKKHLRKKHSALFPFNEDSDNREPPIDDSFQNVSTERVHDNRNSVVESSVENAECNDFNEICKTILLNGQRTGKFICTFEGCGRQYQNENVFKKHLRKKHSALFPFNEDSDNREPPIDDSFQNVSTERVHDNSNSIVDSSVENAEGNDFNEIRKRILLNGQRTGKFVCTFEGCDRQYQNQNAFKKHLRKKHSALCSLIEHNSNEESPEDSFQNFAADQTPVERNIIFEMFNEPIKTDDDAINDLQSTALIFQSDMHSKYSINRKTVTDIFTDVKKQVLAKVCKEIRSKAEHTQLSNYDQKNDLLNFVDSCSKICDFVGTEHLFLDHLSKKELYIAPVKRIVDCEIRDMRNSGFPIPMLKQIELIEIPLRKSLKQLFELPEVLNETLKYQKSLMEASTASVNENNEPLMYSNFVQGSLWKEYVKEYEGKIVIPFFLYNDDYGVNNQLGSHSTSQSICAFYALFPTFPPQFQSRLENILLVLIFYSSVLKDAGNEKTLKILIDEINFVQTEGIDICVDGKVLKVYFKMGLVIGDNLGLNSILDFVKCFVAYFSCRFCRVHKYKMNYMTKLDYSILRNRENYLEDIQRAVSEGGVHQDSIFNSIDHFHIIENPSVDISHDFYETIVHYGICKSLNHFIYKHKYFTLETFNSRKAKFNYGINDSANLAGPVKKKHLDNDTLKASASEMIVLTQHLLTIIGDLVPRKDKVWLYLVNLVEIHDIIIFKEISHTNLEKLPLLITSHHKSYIRLFGDHLRPTFHNLLHYYDIVKMAGSLSGICSIRGEGRHRNFKVTAESTCSRKNIPLTLAKKNQLVLANRMLKNRGFQDKSIHLNLN